ncbi:MAG: hypothetical protein RLZZ127_1797 [Planctomycetota bacterium]|jgi:osmoprotectant transport system permease protein
MEFLRHHAAEFALRCTEHTLLCIAAMAVAMVVAVPLGVVLARRPRLAGLATGAAGLVQTVPSLALLGLLMVLTGRIGWVPSVIALLLYALLPILRNTIVGLGAVPRPVRDAAEALGMTRDQVLWQVSLPLAVPVVVAGLRTAWVWTVGAATLCAFIGAGGLGVFINRGIDTIDPRLVMLGVVPSALLALAGDLVLAGLGRWLEPERIP